MIRINETIARAKKHRWLWLLLVVVFGLLLAFTVVHGTSDQTAADAPAACVALILGFLAVRLLVKLAAPVAPIRRLTSRGPPTSAVARAVVQSARPAAFVLPLRL